MAKHRMTMHTAPRSRGLLALLVLLAVIVSACNLSGAPSEEQIAQTDTALATVPPTRTPPSTSGIPTTVPVTQVSNLPTFIFPTSIIVVPTGIPPQVFPSSTPLPVSIVILSPVSGNVVAGNVQILGSAIHPQFLQYQVEFGPDPNPGNLWFPATSAITSPVLNGLLGIWNTTTVQDSRYQLRLRVYLRDGTLLTTVIGNIAVQNRINTPIPSQTPNIPRPIAAFTQDKASGNVPLTVQFGNQSTGTINSLVWNFGDGNSSSEVNPNHTFGAPGLYTVTLTVNGPGGSSNVTRQINVTSPTAPVAGFTQDRTAGVAPLTVQFADQSSGTVTSYLWNFSDGSTTTERNPVHTFTTPGTYNVFLTVTGPGGSSSVTRQITVNSVIPPTATPTATFTPTFTPSPTNTATATTTFTDTPVASDTPIPFATETPIAPSATYTETTTVIPPTATFTDTATATEIPPTATFTPTEIPAPQALFSASGVLNDPLSVQFTNQSTGDITAYLWDFGDGTTSSEQNPLHTYAGDGTYTVTLTVGIADGRTDSHSEDVTVATPLHAAFSAQPNGLDVQFTNQSTGAVASVTWDFGDGATSNEVSPLHTYAGSGTYTVTLTIGSADGRSDQTSQQVTVAAPLVAGFSAQPNGLDVQFTNQSTGDVTSVTWDFGDGTTSTDVSPLHTYAGGGTYAVTLTIGAADGRSNQTSQQVTVASPLVAGFSAQPNGLDVQFTNQSTGDVASVTWDFGDGATSNEVSPLHTYPGGGTYAVTLTIGSADGRSNQTSQQVTVASPLVAGFSAQPNGLDVQFTNQSTGDVASVTWDFGDGTTSTDVSPLHTYAGGGTYTVTLTIGSADGRSNQTSQQVTVAAPLVAGFSAQPNGLEVQFTNQSTGDVASVTWDFGDGATSNEVSPLHTYPGGGTYAVTLTIGSADGRSNQTSQQVTVAAPLVAGFSAQPNGLDVQFTNQSTGDVASVTWDFGDGATSNEVSPLHTYPGGGTYAVTLTIGSADGRSNQTSQQVTVASPLVAGFSAQPNGLDVQFTNQSTGDVASVTWDFGDGATSNEVSPLHTYAGGGTYAVTLTIGSADGRSNQTSQQVTVASPLVAGFSAQPNGLDVQFTNQSTGDVASVTWDFGDGATSNEVSPLHTYPGGGTYTVTLTIGSADGRSNQTSQQVMVAAALHADFTTQVNGLDVQFASQSTGDIVAFMWDFGDGATSNEQNPLHTYPGGGTYTVTLTVGSADGRSDSRTLDVTVAAPVTAQFSSQVAGLNVQFTDQSSGPVVGYLWDFGDGTTATEQNPLHSYPAIGTYTVSLTVTDANGGSANTSADVSLTEPPQTLPHQTQVDTTPILPDINALAGSLSNIYQAGLNNGKQATVFAKAGDSIFTQPNILSPFATAGQYALNGNEDLQSVIDWFNQTDLNGTTSFNRLGIAVNPNWTAQDLLGPNNADPSVCNGGESPLACELRITQPAIMFVAIGQSDANNGTNPNAFSNTLTQIVGTISSNGTIPVLLTIPDDGSNPALSAINDAIITVANQNSVPLLNAARALNELPNPALNAAPSGAGDLSADAVNNFGVNALNLDLLRVFAAMRNIIGINP